MAEPVIPDKAKLRLLFVECETREHLDHWIRTFLKIQFPSCTVTEESNSNPLDMVWEAYDRMRRNDMAGYARVMSYANRGGFKTLAAAVLEVLVVTHLRRNVAHMAAVKSQSKKAAEYTKGFFRQPYLRDYVVGDNQERIDIVRYKNKVNGDSISQSAFAQLVGPEREQYDRFANYIVLVICTMQGANSAHVEFFVVDEVDVVPKQNINAYYQAQAIPDPRDGFMPMTLLTSTRKSRVGLVQKELDSAAEKGLHVLHWNLIDVTQACEPTRHQPELPRQTYYVNDDLVKHVTKEEFEAMPPGKEKKWYPVEGYAGCRGCRIFSACKGRLATHQKSNSPMLKPIQFAIDKFQSAPTPEYITTEYLCRKPDSTGLVYPRLSEEVHYKTLGEIHELIAGKPAPENFTKFQLIELLKAKSATFHAGMDFGFSHPFAVVTFAVFAEYVFILDCYSQSGLELDDQVVNSEFLRKVYSNPPVWPDMAYPGSITTFRRKGFRMKDWDKGPGSVKAGIEIVRSLLWNGKNQTRMFFVKDDPGVELLFKKLGAYRLQIDSAGTVLEEPEKLDDDEADAMRYGVMNTLGKKGAMKDSTSAIKTEAAAAAAAPIPSKPGQQQTWMTDLIRATTGGADGTNGAVSTQGGVHKVKKGSFKWEMG